MFCEKCGNNISDNALFCSACGAPVPKAETAGADVKSEEAVNGAQAAPSAATAPVQTPPVQTATVRLRLYRHPPLRRSRFRLRICRRPRRHRRQI